MAPPTDNLGHEVTTRAWRWFLALGAAVMVLAMALSGDAGTLAYEAGAGLAVVAVVVGVRLHAPSDARGWHLLGGGIALWAFGDVLWAAHEGLFDSAPFPSFADVPYLAAYPLLVLGVARIVRRRSGPTRDLPALLDAATITVAAALPAWILLVAPAAADSSLSRLGRVVAVAYPVGDLLLVAVVARLLLLPGRRPPAYWLLLAGLVTSLVADAVFAAPSVAEGYTAGDPLDVAYLVGYLLLGAAALHPAMVEVADGDPTTRQATPRALRWRIGAVAGAALSAPALLAYEAGTGDIDHLPLVLVAWVGLLGLVLTRLVVVMRQLAREGQLDPLTRLPNRGHLLARLEQALAQQEPERVAVLHLDLDRFKAVNDAVGRSGGDLLLVDVAGRLRTIVRPGDLVARAGGDEFVVMCRDIADEAAARAVAARLTAGLADPFWVDGSPHFLSASIGISRPGAGGADAADLLRSADAAVARAKARGAVAEVYDPDVERELSLRGRFEHDLYDAVDRGELVLHYQPRLDLRLGDVAGVEALLRWQHPDWGTTKPSSILPIAQETGLIVPIGRWVVTEACRQLAAWHRATGEPAPAEVSVNVAARELLDPGYAAHVAGALAAVDLPARALVVEVDDDALGDAPSALVDTLHQLRALGVHVCIDRFGSGRRSLANIRRVPADRVKVDLGLVSGVADDSGDRVVLSTVLSLGTALGVEVTVTGVETRSQRTQLERMGCAHAQGNLWAPALPPGSVLDAVLGRAPA